jgi:hypothetical protein
VSAPPRPTGLGTQGSKHAQLDDKIAQIANDVNDRIELTIVLRPSQLAALAALFRPSPATAAPVHAPGPGLLTKRQLAATLSVSATKIDRLVRDGLPHETVGSVRRFDLERCRAWLATRGKKATTPAAKPPEEDAIDITRVVRRAGLRVAPGRRT